MGSIVVFELMSRLQTNTSDASGCESGASDSKMLRNFEMSFLSFFSPWEQITFLAGVLAQQARSCSRSRRTQT